MHGNKSQEANVRPGCVPESPQFHSQPSVGPAQALGPVPSFQPQHEETQLQKTIYQAIGEAGAPSFKGAATEEADVLQFGKSWNTWPYTGRAPRNALPRSYLAVSGQCVDGLPRSVEHGESKMVCSLLRTLCSVTTPYSVAFITSQHCHLLRCLFCPLDRSPRRA